MLCDPTEQKLGDSFALVAYIPDPLRMFLDDLRRELVPGCAPNAHVTILPPRPLSGSREAAIATIRGRIGDFSPFEVHAGDVTVFPVTNVVYLTLKTGGHELTEMHRAL